MSKHKVAFLSGERPSTTVNVGISILLAIGLTALIFGVLWQLKGTFIRVGVTEGEYAILQRGQGWFRIDAAGKSFTFEGWDEPLKDVAEE